ncbi:uncharacterized protein MONBRDRAFT_26527 [Monosiga brevicollis MX1]|uniref:Peptidase M14 domain-containing protein n=1 Tax=Monosiga brevicollis TaxID=81824 RepID=A9V2M3_MONBE|nr:uncharacterized protein MONBRDRAFT_26527 [Monosiga brevicollis MX1]EDQ88283.1 predicted protein [Monosiga brevicollis MX1]|eukprot:XP_001746876.1 hypothetical protein [Monosiga brevicollis MX1]
MFRGDPSHLVFDAIFESGNLGSVEQLNEDEYDLFIREDFGSPRHSLWFYFTVTRARAGQVVLFNVHNLCKTRSLIRDGMAPVVRSSSSGQWQRLPSSDCFYHSDCEERKHYVCSFLLAFEGPEVIYEIAYCYPYSLTDLKLFLSTLPQSRGRDVPLLTISQPHNLKRYRAGEQMPGLIISARVHPGETPSSYLCEGLLRFLVSSDPHAEELLEKFVIQVIPMLNPDGVVMGQYRCNAKGFDLNRCWRMPTVSAQPIVHAVKRLLFTVSASMLRCTRAFNV